MSELKNISEVSVAVIVPVYKVEGTLEATVRSIQSQTYSNIEIILVDDGSPDNSGLICDNLAKEDSRIKVIHQKNAGVSAARNAGIEASQSDFLCFVDSDDEISFDFVEKALEIMCESEAQLAVCGICNYFSDKTEFIKKTNDVYDYTSLAYEECMNLFSDWIMMLCVGKLFSKKTIMENKLRFKEGVTCGEDGLFMYSFLRYCDKVAFLDIPAYRYYCFRSNSASRFFSLETQKDVFDAKIDFLKKHCKDEEIEKYCARKALGNIRSRVEYLAKKRKADFRDMNSALDYYLPYILPYENDTEIFTEFDKNWFEKNRSEVIAKNSKALLNNAIKHRKKEKREAYINEFKGLSFKGKIKFLMKVIW